MRDHIARWTFIIRTKLTVAYANFAVERAFALKVESRLPTVSLPPLPHIPPLPPLTAPAVIAGTLLLATIGIGSLSLTGNALWRATPAETDNAAINMPVIANAKLPDAGNPVIPSRPHYALAVDKAAKVLLVLEEQDDAYRVIRTFGISLGKIVGTKQKAGDMRTPVGYYRIVGIKERGDLPAYYGPRAFVTDYPNSYDIASGRTGGGIWLHGTGLGSRTRDTHGCVVLDDDNLKALDTWVSLDTPVAIFPEDFHLPVVDGRVEKRYFTLEFFYGDTSLARRG